MSTIDYDFEKVKKIIETTKDLCQFPALKNIVEAFSRKWHPDTVINTDPSLVSSSFVSKYNDYCDYLRLKVDFEYSPDVV